MLCACGPEDLGALDEIESHELAIDGVTCDKNFDCVGESCDNLTLYTMPGGEVTNHIQTGTARYRLNKAGGTFEERLIVGFADTQNPLGGNTVRTRSIILSASGVCNDYGRPHAVTQTLDDAKVINGVAGTSVPSSGVGGATDWSAWIFWSEKNAGSSNYVADIDFAKVTPTGNTPYTKQFEWGTRPAVAAGWSATFSTTRIVLADEDCTDLACTKVDINLYWINPSTGAATYIGEVQNPPGDPSECDQSFPEIAWNKERSEWLVIWTESAGCDVGGAVWKVWGQKVAWNGGTPILVAGRLGPLYQLLEGGEAPDDNALAANPVGNLPGNHGYLMLPDFDQMTWLRQDGVIQHDEPDPYPTWGYETDSVQTTTASDGAVPLHYEVIYKVPDGIADADSGLVRRDRYTNGVGAYAPHQTAVVSAGYNCAVDDCTKLWDLALGFGDNEAVALYRFGSAIQYSLMNRP